MDLDSLDHEPFVQRAIDLARTAGDRDDGPYGSLLVHDGEIIMEETNRERTDDDIALHPELTLARRAASELSASECNDTVMYTSTEPCPMCATGMVYAGLGGVVYSVSGEDITDAFGAPTGPSCQEIFGSFDHDIPVVGGVLREEGMALHREYR